MPRTPLIALLTLLAGPVPSTSAQAHGGGYRSEIFPGGLERVHAFGDINGDGFQDLLGMDFSSELRVLLGPSYSPHDYPGVLNGRFGFLDDHDGDGWLEIVRGAPGSFGGTIWVYSGQSGALRYEVLGPDGLGASVLPIHDLDGDGYLDFVSAFGVPIPGKPTFQGTVRFLSGIDGSTILENTFGNQCSLFSSFVSASYVDHDGDGFADVLVGSPFEYRNGSGVSLGGAVHVLSSVTGASLLRFQENNGSLTGDMGTALASVPDLDGDGLDEIVVGSPNAIGWSGTGATKGHVGWYSSMDGSPLFDLNLASFESHYLGDFLGAGADIDDDEFPDVWCRMRATLASSTERLDGVFFFSGLDGQFLRFEPEDFLLAQYPLAAFDHDGDGLRDMVFPYEDAATSTQGVRFLLRERWIHSPAHEISVAVGASLPIDLEFPNSARFYLYQLLASGSGTGPMDVQGMPVPLTYDLMVLSSYLGTLPPLAVNFTGVLDSSGRGEAQLRIPPGSLSSSLVGRNYYLAAIAGPPWQWEYSTGYWFFRIVP